MDISHKILVWLDHNRHLALALGIALCLVIGLASCAPKTGSLLFPEVRVSAAQLDTEVITVETDLQKRAIEITALQEKYNADVAAANKRIETAKADIKSQKEMRIKLVEIAGALGTAAAAGTINPAAGIAAAIQVVTLLAAGGAVLDNRRKDKIITAKKA